MTDRETERFLESPCPRRRPVDGLVVDGRHVWLVMGDAETDTVGMLLEADGVDGAPPMRLCRGLLDGDRLLMGDADPLTDRLVSDLMFQDELDHG